MLKASFLDLSGRSPEDGAVAVRPAWEVRAEDGVTSWFHVRLSFTDGAGVDALAVVADGRVSVEDVEARPALSLADLTALADWIAGPLSEACGVTAFGAEMRAAQGAADGACDAGAGGAIGAGDAGCAQEGAGAQGASGAGGAFRGARDVEGGEGRPMGGAGRGGGARRARPAWPRGVEGSRRVARAYRTAQEEGADPVLAVMAATGHSRRRSLRLIAQARDAGFLAPRHTRR